MPVRLFTILCILFKTCVSSSKAGDQFDPLLKTKVPAELRLNEVKPVFPHMKIYHEHLEVSAAYDFSTNSLTDRPSAIVFSERYNYGCEFHKFRNPIDFSIRSELAYSYYLDSVWDLKEDQIYISVIQKKMAGKAMKFTFSSQLSSSLLPSYKMKSGYNNGTIRQRYGGFFNPGDLQISYGLLWVFWKHSNLNLSFATLKISSSPVYISEVESGLPGKYKRDWDIKYGLSLNSRIHHAFSKRWTWYNQTRYFLNSLTIADMRLDFLNELTCMVNGFLGISFHSLVRFNPAISNRVEIVNELKINYQYDLKQGK